MSLSDSLRQQTNNESPAVAVDQYHLGVIVACRRKSHPERSLRLMRLSFLPLPLQICSNSDPLSFSGIRF